MTGEAADGPKVESVTGELKSISERYGVAGRLFPDGARRAVKVRFRPEHRELARQAVGKRATVAGEVVLRDVAGQPVRIEKATIEETSDPIRHPRSRSRTGLGPGVFVRFEPATYATIDRLAAEENVTDAEMIRRLVDAGLSQQGAALMYTIVAGSWRDGLFTMRVLADDDGREVWGEDALRALSVDYIPAAADQRLEPTAYVRTGPWERVDEGALGPYADVFAPVWRAPAEVPEG